jgi:hypothetical protein
MTDRTKCYVHGGATPRGRGHGAFRHGRFTAKAIEERAMAKELRKEVLRQWHHDSLMYRGAPRLLKEAAYRAEKELKRVLELELAWMDRHHARDARGNLIAAPVRRRRRKKDPESV